MSQLESPIWTGRGIATAPCRREGLPNRDVLGNGVQFCLEGEYQYKVHLRKEINKEVG